jgi:transposase
MGVDKWARQLREDRNGISPQAMPLTTNQLRIRELEKQFRRDEGQYWISH